MDYLRESLEAAETAEETEAWIADGAYASEELAELAADKNIGLLTTGLRGRKPREILTQKNFRRYDPLCLPNCSTL